MTIKLKNNVVGYLATAINASDTGIVLQSGNGTSFPSLSAGEYFYATFVSSGGTLEVVKVTARVGDTMTVVRGQDGSSATGFAAGSRVEMRVNAQAVLDVVNQITAAQIEFTPYGNISATTVQGAIQEEINDLAASTGASLVGFSPAGYLSSTTVQGAISEVVTDLASTSGASNIGFAATGTITSGTVQSAITQVLTLLGYGSAYADLFSGNGVLTTFTLSVAPGNINQLDVSIAGVTQRPGVDYTWTSGTTLTFTTAPAAGTNNILVRYVQTVPVGTYDQTIAALLAANPGLILSYDNAASYIFAIVDAAKRRLAAWTADGTMLAKLGVSVGVANGLTFTRNADLTYTLSLGTVQGELPLSGSKIKGAYDNDNYLWGVTDSIGRRMLTIYLDGTVEGKFTSPELIAARGTRTTLDQRMSTALSPYGAPKQYIINEHRLRRFRYLRRKRLLSESAQIVIAMIGDSYTHDSDRYSGPVASTLIAELGDAGGGWVGFASLSGDINGNVRPALYPLTRIGTWGEGTSSNYYTIPGPDLGQAVSSNVGDRQTVTGPATPVLSAVRFFWNGTVDGVMRYRWNGGAWTTINVQGSGVQSALLGGLPASGAWTLDMEVVSGTCQPMGVDIQSAASGVRVHKLGCTGSRANQWAAVNAAQWQASITSLAPQLVTIMLGTNDQTIARTPAEFAADLTTIITRVKAAMPSVDIAIMMPAENQRGLPTLMSTYAAAAVEVAYTQNCAYLDTQYLFGDASNPTEYGSAGTIPLYSPDLVHPVAATGGRVIVDGVMRFLTTV